MYAHSSRKEMNEQRLAADFPLQLCKKHNVRISFNWKRNFRKGSQFFSDSINSFKHEGKDAMKLGGMHTFF